jgi:hypothetical protein
MFSFKTLMMILEERSSNRILMPTNLFQLKPSSKLQDLAKFEKMEMD